MTRAQEAAINRACAHECVRQELVEALAECRRELHACQAVIHLAGGFDPEYVKGAQAAIKRADAVLTKAKEQA
jgi:hypothetical protein